MRPAAPQTLSYEELRFGVAALVALHRLAHGCTTLHQRLLLFLAHAHEHVDELDVGGHPFEGRQRALVHPAHIALAIVARGFAALLVQVAQEAVHGEMEVGVIVFERVEVLQARDAHVQLFSQLASAGLLGVSLASILPPGNSHSPVHLAVAALHGQDLVVALDDSGCHTDGLHAATSPSHNRRAVRATLQQCNRLVSQIDGCQ